MLDTKLLSEDLQSFSKTNAQFWDTSKESFPAIKELYDLLMKSSMTFESQTETKQPTFLYGIPKRGYSCDIASDIRPYSITAIDGSQVESDDLESQTLPFFIINIGALLIDYPKKKVSHFESHPELFDPDRIERELDQNTDFFSKDFNTLIPAFRTKKEFDFSLRMMANLHQHDMVLMDGGLIQWHLQDKPDTLKDYALQSIRQVLSDAKEKQIHVIGYISGTKSSDILGSLRILHCSKDSFNCSQCHDSLCKVFSRISDDHLFREILPFDQTVDWQISPLFESVASILTEYNGHRIFFFYVYNNREFARIECAEHSVGSLGNIINSLLDQLKKGFGYPVVLQEAHELAVITKMDRLVLDQCLFQIRRSKSKLNPQRSKNSSKRIKYI